ncbi:hypothetical protein [Virgibacillus proomii]|uniref:hypothetical protein n=1 Tax=Virgibacillus proomii TaxID=84407 RepID=UPI001C1085E2|nr:hypothetical protein [Virgibacillus proomii]MBU5266297.1 hypothetical protein [Virgibacillus proomii]
MVKATQLGVGYSIGQKIEQELGVKTVLKYDGIKLPTEKPFILVEQMQNNHTQISKLREAIQTTFRFQIGIYAETQAQRSSMQDKLRDLFLFAQFPLYDDMGAETGVFFDVGLTNEVPIDADDLSDKTNMHRLYFDVEVAQIYHKNRTEN